MGPIILTVIIPINVPGIAASATYRLSLYISSLLLVLFRSQGSVESLGIHDVAEDVRSRVQL